MVKELHVAHNLEELNQKASIHNATLQQHNLKDLIVSAITLLGAVEKFGREKDEELEYTYSLKYIDTVTAVLLKPSQQEHGHLKELIVMKNLRKCIKRSEELSYTLRIRYEQKYPAQKPLRKETTSNDVSSSVSEDESKGIASTNGHNVQMDLIDIEGDLETYKQENESLEYKLGQMTTEKESVDNLLKTIQFEKNEQGIRCEELENENRRLRQKLENCRMELRQKEVAHIQDKERLKVDLALQKELTELKVRDLQKEVARIKHKERLKADLEIQKELNELKVRDFQKKEVAHIQDKERLKADLELQKELNELKVRDLQKEVAHIKDKERLKADLEIQKELNEIKFRDLQKKEMQLRESYKYKDKTLEAIRQLIEKTENDRPRRSRSRTRRRSSSFSSATSDSEVQVMSAVNKTRPRVISVPHLDSPLSPIKSRSEGVAVSNPRRFRAHSSDNDRRLEHTPGQPVKTGTVFQPVMKKKKSVRKSIAVDDLVRKVSKYCLNLLEAEGGGGLETQLHKDDVLPSRSGGAQVASNDVEILKQVSPTNVNGSQKKRTSSTMLTSPASPLRGGSGEVLATHDEIDTQVLHGDTVEQRCATGIGHQSASKRSRQQ